jgi:tRNA-dihydrouridine synthase
MESSFKIFFAPLQGYNDRVYRRLHAEHFGGVDSYYSPFIRVQPDGSIKKKDKMDVDPSYNQKSVCFELIPQILGGKVDNVRLLINFLEKSGYKRIDINLGCPFPMIANRGEGAGMLKMGNKMNPNSINTDFEKLMYLVTSYPKLEISLKMRLGWENISESLGLLPLINNTPLHSIVLHARLGKMGYKGECDLESFEKFHKDCRHKLIYNGDILTIDDYNKITQRFPDLEGVMIGRGLLANPNLASEIKSKNHDRTDKKRVLKTFHDNLLNEYAGVLHGENQILSKMKGLWDYFLPETDKRLLKRIKKTTRLSTYISIVNEIFII